MEESKAAPVQINMALIRKVHAPALRRAVAIATEEAEEKESSRPSLNGAEIEAEAVLQLKSLRLDGLNIAAIDNLEPFDACEELYLAHNSIRTIENLDLLGNLKILSLQYNRIISKPLTDSTT